MPRDASPLYQVGDRVDIRYSDWRGRIVELRGPLGPGGAWVYRVRVSLKPKARSIELMEDQLSASKAPPKAQPTNIEPRGKRPKAKGKNGRRAG